MSNLVKRLRCAIPLVTSPSAPPGKCVCTRCQAADRIEEQQKRIRELERSAAQKDNAIISQQKRISELEGAIKFTLKSYENGGLIGYSSVERLREALADD